MNDLEIHIKIESYFPLDVYQVYSILYVHLFIYVKYIVYIYNFNISISNHMIKKKICEQYCIFTYIFDSRSVIIQ